MLKSLCCFAFVSVLCMLADPSYAQSRSKEAVDVVLLLAIDVSASVDDDEFELQREGYAEAFRDPQVISALKSGDIGQIAISVIHWSGFGSVVIVLPWRIVHDKESSFQLAVDLGRLERAAKEGTTCIGNAMRFSTFELLRAPYETKRLILDVSGDGHDTCGDALGTLRDTAVSNGITINGLPIESDEKDIAEYYRKNVIGGTGSFLVSAKSYQSFQQAIKQKLIRELSRMMAMLE